MLQRKLGIRQTPMKLWNEEMLSGSFLTRHSTLDESSPHQGQVGGLLAMEDTNGTSSTTDDKHYVYFYDANGNVGQLVDTSDGSLFRAYEYDPYGRELNYGPPYPTSGWHDANPFRFSTKYCDDELTAGLADDLYYYGYRFYSPRLGRWLNRDPIGEKGGNNLYESISNNPVNALDILGLRRFRIWASAFIEPSAIVFPYFIDTGAIWLGNARTFGPGPLIAPYSKMAHEVIIESDPGKPAIITNRSIGGLSTVISFIYGIRAATAPAPALASVTRNGCVTNVHIVGSVANPLMVGAPSIDYEYHLSFDALLGTLTYSGSHDHYPWHELYVDRLWLVQDAPLGPTSTPLDLVFTHLIPGGTFHMVPKDCCRRSR